MKVFMVTTAFFFLTLLFLALAKDHGLRALDAEKVVEENQRTLTAVVTKDSVDPKLGTKLTQLYQDYILRANNSDASGPQNKDDYVAVDVAFTSILDKDSAKEVLRPAVQVDFIACFQYMCSVRVPVVALKAISSINSVQSLHSAEFITQTGSVTTEGDKAMLADLARSTFSVNGTGLLIGVLSNSYNCDGNAASDIASGDLPSGANDIVVLQENCRTSTDEGRAMMQLIHDVAPGARLAFHTAEGGQASFAFGILELATAGCDVIVEDIFYIEEPMFQDGIIAQAINGVVARGIPFFSAAGNIARTQSWDAPTGFDPVTIRGKVLHRFGSDTRGNPITRMRISTSADLIPRVLVFQWDQPQKSVSGTVGCQSDIDIYLYRKGRLVARSVNKNIIGGDPYEEFFFIPIGVGLVTYEFEIRRVAGPSPTYMKLVVFGDVIFEFPTDFGVSYGHANAALTAGVGAARYTKTPAFNVSPPEIELFSAAGGVPIFFSTNGSRLPSPEIRNQPRFVGPNGGATTFFGEQDSFGTWRFFGTSAAAPHVAAVAALMLQFKGGRKSLTPAQIYSTLEATAVDMNDPFTTGFDVGFDFGTGYGLVNAQAALQVLAN